MAFLLLNCKISQHSIKSFFLTEQELWALPKFSLSYPDITGIGLSICVCLELLLGILNVIVFFWSGQK